jgi:hypothetical protein
MREFQRRLHDGVSPAFDAEGESGIHSWAAPAPFHGQIGQCCGEIELRQRIGGASHRLRP